MTCVNANDLQPCKTTNVWSTTIAFGTIALVKEGDSITIDADKRLIQVNVSARELATRRKKWKQPKPRYTRGLLAKYVKLVSSASKGAVTD